MKASMDDVFGKDSPSSPLSEFNAMTFVIRQHLAGVRTSTLVQVKAVSNSGGVTPVGTVDVLPLVSGVDGAGKIVPHGIVYGIPYFRLQGGMNAVILDPTPGDIGIAIFADRDISSVISTKGVASPGSGRRNDMADGMYLGGVLNGAPSQYVQFSTDGITLISPVKVKVQAPSVEMDAAEEISLNAPSIVLNGAISQGSGTYAGEAVFQNLVTALDVRTASGVSLQDHPHSGVKSGEDESGGPVAT